ncbi:MAG: hypothetical protein H6553_08990 [Chitinophagales bacterium]|nr:hypothetical protein [Chitinophagales bacterium]
MKGKEVKSILKDFGQRLIDSIIGALIGATFTFFYSYLNKEYSFIEKYLDFNFIPFFSLSFIIYISLFFLLMYLLNSYKIKKWLTISLVTVSIILSILSFIYYNNHLITLKDPNTNIEQRIFAGNKLTELGKAIILNKNLKKRGKKNKKELHEIAIDYKPNEIWNDIPSTFLLLMILISSSIITLALLIQVSISKNKIKNK